ncbi:response regulator [Herbiconiux sp. CPCC 205763]|uniref:Response regulator n=1 Tax=Herbiconiux aconitum TaxID=2970913 RepID=A0ABT2GMF0_9MICO|nr:response regulator [Herbiconiux aconitum]MCS5717338.1 response regulator [Herbiconiux aconitum]
MDEEAPLPDRMRRQLDTLAAMATDLAGQFSLEPLLERILAHTMELLGGDSGSICTVDEVAGTYRKEVDLGVGCQSGRTFPLDEGVTGEVVRRRSPVIFTEYADIPGGHIPAPERDLLHGVIGVPIRWNGSIIGSCVVFSRDPGRRFTADDAALLELFGTHAAIAITNARLHALAAERARDTAIMAERERMVRDVHDTVGRGLAAVLLHLDDAERRLEPDAGARSAVAGARASAHAALTDTRRTVLGLGPALLDGNSLGEAIALELAWVESTAALATRLVVIGEPTPLDPDAARQLFRITQESLTNVIEHARARSVRVGLVYGSDSTVALIEDDGCGFDPSAAHGSPGGLGLHGLVARARHLGGSLLVDSTPGWGTRIRAEIPSAPADPIDRARSRWRVLVVHDSPVVRAGLVRMLALAEPDIQVVGEIADSTQVVDAYELLRPHVVLTHLRMPHIDGVRLTSYLRAADPVAATVLLVDSVSDDGVREAAQAGAVGFVKHDVDAAGLARAVVAAARGDSLMTVELFSSSAGVGDAGGEHLTAREREVRALVEQGLPYKQIASALDISVKTVEKHVGAILRKTGAPNRRALARR